MVTPLRDPLGGIPTSNVLISGSTSRGPLITPLQAPLDIMNTSFSEHFHPSSIVVPPDEGLPPPDPLPGEPTVVPILKGNDRRVIMKRYLADQNREREMENESLVYHEMRARPPSPIMIPQEEEEDDDFYEGPPVLTPMSPIVFDYEPYDPPDNYLQVVRYPQIVYTSKASTMTKQSPKRDRRKKWPPVPQAIHPPRTTQEAIDVRLARLKLRESKKKARFSEEETQKKEEEDRKKMPDIKLALLNLLDKTNHALQCNKISKGKGGRPLKKSRGPKAQENNAQRAWERDQRVALAEARKKELQDLCNRVQNARIVDENHIEMDGVIYEKPALLQQAEEMAAAIRKDHLERCKAIKPKFKKVKSHKARMYL